MTKRPLNEVLAEYLVSYQERLVCESCKSQGTIGPDGCAACGAPLVDGARAARMGRLIVETLITTQAAAPIDHEMPQPTFYPCGCSKHKVNLGGCDLYKPYERP